MQYILKFEELREDLNTRRRKNQALFSFILLESQSIPCSLDSTMTARHTIMPALSPILIQINAIDLRNIIKITMNDLKFMKFFLSFLHSLYDLHGKKVCTYFLFG